METKETKVSFYEAYPEMSKEWHPVKNGELKPSDVSPKSRVKIWWYLPFDDPETGKHFDFEWQAIIYNRTKLGHGCPFISNKQVWKGYNDIETTYPDIANEWHPTKNGDKKPSDYVFGSIQKVWWYLPYDDPETGKHFDFEWQASIYDRIKRGLGCPYLSGKTVWRGFNDLETKRPDLAREWHPIKNGNKKPSDYVFGSIQKVWWYLPYDDPKTGKHFDFEWQAKICNRTKLGNGCPFISNKQVWKGYNDIETTFPNIAKEWHPTKNGDNKPSEYTCGNDQKVWWYLPYDDPETGKHFDFEWQASIYARTKLGRGCPFISNKLVCKGYNDFATRYPKLAAQWNYRLNKRRPEDYISNSYEEVWWVYSYDDPETGKHFDFEWKVAISYMVQVDGGCPILTGHVVWPGYNDLETLFPDVAKWWHPWRNGILKPSEITARSHKKVWWYLPYDDPETGKHFDFEWQAIVKNRTYGKSACPYLSGQGVWPGYNDLETLFPDVAKWWHPWKNGNLKPSEITARNHKEVWWYLPYDDPETGKHFDFEWYDDVASMTTYASCPYIVGKAAWKGYNDLETKYPDIAKEWHPWKNGKIKASDVLPGSNKKVWWYLPYDDPKTGKHFDFEWKAIINDRTSEKSVCPYISGKAVWRGYNDLESCDYELALEWHPKKNRKKPYEFTYHSRKKAWWICSMGHEWRSTIDYRANGAGCPYCSKQRIF